MVLGLKECLVECATLCVKSEVIQCYLYPTKVRLRPEFGIRISDFRIRNSEFGRVCVLKNGKYLTLSYCLFTSCRDAGTEGTGGPGGALCFEWGFMQTFPGNQDVAVK